MDVPSTILRALAAFQGDVENGLIEDADVADIEAARAWTQKLTFAWNRANAEPETRLDEQLPYVVGDSHGVGIGEQTYTLAAFATEDLAAGFIGTLPQYESGRYWLDGPADDVAADRVPTTLEAQVAAAHAVPHMHEVAGEEIGHHRLQAMASAGILPDNTVCGLLRAHDPHPWTEDGREYLCGGREGKNGNPRKDLHATLVLELAGEPDLYLRMDSPLTVWVDRDGEGTAGYWVSLGSRENGSAFLRITWLDGRRDDRPDPREDLLDVSVPSKAVGDGTALARLAVNVLRGDRDDERARLASSSLGD